MTSCATLLAELIGHDTVNPGGDELALCRRLATDLEHLGADRVDLGTVPRPGQPGGWVFARFGTPRLLVNAHVDTVPANRGWSTDPHVAQVTSDRVIGLGSADTKGAIACVLTALATERPHDVGILFSGDEERTSTVLPAFLASDRAEGIERAIVCEPTSRCAGVRHRGVLCFRADVRGQGGHSSRADHLPKPIVTLARLAVRLAELGERFIDTGPDDMKGLCLNVAGLDGGVAFNVIPEAASLTWSMRHPPGFDAAALEEEQKRLAADIDAGITVTKILDHTPFAIRDQDAMAAILGDHPRAWVPLDYWTEAAVLSAHGIDAVVIGPGDITQAHAADEFVTFADLDWATELFRGIFRSSRAG